MHDSAIRMSFTNAESRPTFAGNTINSDCRPKQSGHTDTEWSNRTSNIIIVGLGRQFCRSENLQKQQKGGVRV